MKLILITLFTLISCHSIVYAQDVDYSKFSGSKVKVKIIVNIPDCFIKTFDDSLDRAYAVYKTLGEIRNGSPEELLTTIFSAQKRDWLTNLYKDVPVNITETEIERRSMADSSNYFQFIHKITFNHNGHQVAIVKFREYINRNPGSIYSLQMQNTNGQWYVIQVGELNEIECAIRCLTTQYLNVFIGGVKNDDKDIQKLIKDTRENQRVLNITKLAIELKKQKVSNPNIYSLLCDN